MRKAQQESMLLEKSIASLTSGFSSRVPPNADVASTVHDETKHSEASVSTMDLGSTLFNEPPMSASQQLLQSQAIQAALGHTQHENNFYWLEKYYQQEQNAAHEPNVSRQL